MKISDSDINVGTAGNAAPRDIPYGIEDAKAFGAWRKDVLWPAPHHQSFDCAMQGLQSVLGCFHSIDDPDLQDIVLLGLASIFASTLPKGAAALAVQQEQQLGVRLVGAAPELAYLRGETGATPAIRDIGNIQSRPMPRAGLVRRIARTCSWTPWPRIAQTLMKPEATAISHNGLLRQAASTSRVTFHHADSMFLQARRQYGDRRGISGWEDLVGPLATALTNAYNLTTEFHDRLLQLVTGQIFEILEAASRDVTALRETRRLPNVIWAGTGGYWPGRALSIEVLRRGGAVRRFDHGGGMGLNSLAPLWATTELLVSSQFSLPTRRLAERAESSGVRNFLRKGQSLDIDGGDGDPLHRAASRIARKAAPGQLRVTYTPPLLTGFQQHLPPLLPDLISLDWQMRFAKKLKTLPIQLMCRPHPEGLFKNKPHPLAAITPLSSNVFEDLIADTDVFVFEYIQSTAFYEALCTDRPIVLIDFGLPIYQGKARAMLEARCRIMPARFDDRNRPHIDTDQLETAIFSKEDTVDPSWFRSHLIGDEEA
ncbi:MAG: hypothetical protein HOJ06_07955 [Rhodospirillaceae bacterium]|nr:hypothetical protein [Rhodospirillaceae bacterium]